KDVLYLPPDSADAAIETARCNYGFTVISRSSSADNCGRERVLGYWFRLIVGGIAQLFHIFFFQAEDGIRGRNVTGVQTYALPICLDGGGAAQSPPGGTAENGHLHRAGEGRSYLAIRVLGGDGQAEEGSCRQGTWRGGGQDQLG